MSNRVYWCLGLYASASTWLYNIVRELSEVESHGKTQTYFCSGATDWSILDRSDNVNIVKSHEIGDEKTILELARRSTKIFVSVRDTRDAVSSLMLYHGYEFGLALSLVEANMRLCMRFARDPRTFLFRYEKRFFEDPKTLNQLASALGMQISNDDLANMFAKFTRPAVEAYIAKMPQMPGVLQERISGDRLDPRTHWHTHHAGRSGEVGRWKHTLTAAQVEEVQARAPNLVA